MSSRTKYPKTPHLPWSPGATSDDAFIQSLSFFEGKQIIVTEKLDGENCTIGPDYTHARSTDSSHHPSRSWVKGLQAKIGHRIHAGTRLCGENLYAKHSIGYTFLPSYFLLFSIWTNELCWSWDATNDYARVLQLNLVPVLYHGTWDEGAIKSCWTGVSAFGDESEGYVVRLAGSFPHDAFHQSVAKFVRPNHVQTSDHWMQGPVTPNGLR